MTWYGRACRVWLIWQEVTTRMSVFFYERCAISANSFMQGFALTIALSTSFSHSIFLSIFFFYIVVVAADSWYMEKSLLTLELGKS